MTEFSSADRERALLALCEIDPEYARIFGPVIGAYDAAIAQIARDDEHYEASQAMSEKHRKAWVEACRERDAEKRRADGLAEDARRYRWLRDNVRVMEMCFNTNHPARWHLYGEQMDAELDRVCAIDAALAAEGPPA